MKTVLVTGANRGIGLALVEHYRGRGDRVVGVCRHSSPALDASGAQVESGIDVTDDAAVRTLPSRLGNLRLDVLVLNAGVLGSETLGALDDAAFASIRRQFEVNAIGPLRVAEVLLDHLAPDAKIGIVTSRMGSIEDNGSGGYYGYRASKAAVNAIGRSLARDLHPRGVAVFLLHPGYVATDMVGRTGDVSPAESAAQLVERLDTLPLAYSGSFWHANGTRLPW